MSLLRALRSAGEIVIFGLGVLLLGAGGLGAVVAFGIWRSESQMTPAHLRIFSSWALGALALGGALLLLYRRVCTSTPSELAPPSGGVQSGPLRRLSGGLLVAAAFVCVLCGAVGGGLRLASSLPGERYRQAGDMDLLRTAPWSLALGFLLLWGAYLLWTDREELERQLQMERRQYLLAVAGAVSASAGGGHSWFGWRDCAVRLAGSWAMISFLGFQLQAWPLLGSGLGRAAEFTAAVWLSQTVLILIHELGHLLAGAAVWMTPAGARVGRGPLLLRPQLGGVDLRLHAWPSDGCAFLTHRTERLFRARTFAMCAGGPAAHALAVAAMFWAARSLPAAAAPFLLAAGLAGAYHLLLGSLFPFRMTGGRTRRAEYAFVDAAALLNAFRLPASHVRWRVGVDLGSAASKRAFASPDEQRASAEELAALVARYPENGFLHLLTALAAQHRSDWEQAAGHWERFLAVEGENGLLPPEVHAWARNEQIIARVMVGDPAGARRDCLALLESDAPRRFKIEQLDRLACLPLMQGLRAYAPEALDWADRALALDPSSATLQGTRGSLLMELGRWEEGAEILHRVRAASASPIDQGISALYLALAAREQGRQEEARALAADAFRLYPGQAWMQLRWEAAEKNGVRA